MSDDSKFWLGVWSIFGATISVIAICIAVWAIKNPAPDISENKSSVQKMETCVAHSGAYVNGNCIPVIQFCEK